MIILEDQGALLILNSARVPRPRPHWTFLRGALEDRESRWLGQITRSSLERVESRWGHAGHRVSRKLVESVSARMHAVKEGGGATDTNIFGNSCISKCTLGIFTNGLRVFDSDLRALYFLFVVQSERAV